ncbi:hypothetical protein C8F01DRAFT_1307453 [Mycena amicta]|nr:hypothetical protein C8F01DRAFT_1307453 [Mycena amicta]
MPQKLFLLDLAPEIIVKCLLYLPLDDLATCLRVGNRFLAAVITDSPEIQYIAELEHAGMEENVHSMKGLSISDRLGLLRERESRWRTLSPAFRYSIALGVATDNIVVMDLIDGLYFAGVSMNPSVLLATSLKYIALAPGAQPACWKTVFQGKPFMNFQVALAEHDLLVILTWCARPTYPQLIVNPASAPCANDPATTLLDAHLLSFTTGEPHPLAACPILPIYRFSTPARLVDVHLNLDAVIEILGGTLAIAFRYFEEPLGDENMNRLYLVDWQTGLHLFTSLYAQLPIPIPTSRSIFLSPDIIGIPQTTDNAIEIVKLPSTPSEHPPTSVADGWLGATWEPAVGNTTAHPFDAAHRCPRAALHIPSVEIVPYSYRSRASSCQPPTSTSFRSAIATHNQAHFLPSANKSLFVLQYYTVRSQTWDTSSGHEYEDSGYSVIPWNDWGPRCARSMHPLQFGGSERDFLRGEEHDFVLATSSGMRMVGLRSDSEVLNFNPREVARAKRLSEARKKGSIDEGIPFAEFRHMCVGEDGLAKLEVLHFG